MPAVLFDLDGVLVASGPAHAASWQMVARKHGLQISNETFRSTFGRPSRDIIRMLWGEHTTDAQIREIDEAKEAAYRELITGMVPLMIGARETLTRLHQAGIPLAIATSGPPENLELVLREARIGQFFTAWVHGFDIQRGKPAPDCFLLAAERVNAAPQNCVVIEDAPVGIQAAQAAGMPVLALTGTYPADYLARCNPTGILERLGDLTPDLVTSVVADAVSGRPGRAGEFLPDR